LRPAEGILIFVIAYVLSTVVSVLLNPVLSLRANTALSVVVTVVTAVLLLRMTGRSPAGSVGLRWAPAGAVVYAVLAALALILPVLSLAALVVRYFEIPLELVEALEELIRAGSVPELLWVLVVAALGAGISEELVFRGILQNSLASRLRARWALVISAAVFALLHTPWRFPPAFVLGLVLGALYLRSQSLLPAIAAHITVNSVSILVLFLVEMRGEGVLPPWLAEDSTAPVWMIVASILAFYLFMRGFWSATRRTAAPGPAGSGPRAGGEPDGL
jgi:hypothetical protein